MQSAAESSSARIGRYALLEPLGEGGMARVFLAQKDGSTEICVLKRLHGHIEANKLAAKRFHREAHIASLLSHRAIARVLDAGIEEESFCIAMEFIAGQTLEAILDAHHKRDRLLPLSLALLVAQESLEALAYAHDFAGEDGRALNIVHRDLTPRNIMASYAGKVKIIDFGIARGDVDELKTAPGVLMGTPYYMSPEQARTLPVDRRSDLYTFAAVLFEMLAGKRLVRAKGRAAILAEVAKEAAPPITSLNPSVPKAFDAVLQRALDKDPEKRHASARELLDELLRAAGNVKPASFEELGRALRELFPEAEAKAAEQISRVRTSGSSELLPAEPTKVDRPFDSLPPQLEQTPTSARRRRRSSQALLAIAAAIILPGAIGGLYYATQTDEVAPQVAVSIVPAAPKISVKQATPAAEERIEDEKIDEPARPRVRKQPPQQQHAAEQEPAKPVEVAKPAPSPTAELEHMAAQLRANPRDAKLRTLLYDRIDAAAAKLPAPRQRKIKAAIDPALLDEDVTGLERGIDEIRKAIAAGEMP